MSKIAVFTWYKLDMNCGQTLQAFATVRVLQKLASKANVKIISFEPPKRNFLKIRKINLLLSIRCISYPFKLWKKIHVFNQFIRQYIPSSRALYSIEEVGEYLKKNKFDILVAGSDQIWNLDAGFVFPLYFLPFKGYRKFSYASSMFSIDRMGKYKKELLKIEKLLQYYQDISAREENSSKILSILTGKEVPLVLDPTLLLNANQYRKISKSIKGTLPSGTYLICYFMGNVQIYKHYVEEIKKTKNIKNIFYIDTSYTKTAMKRIVPTHWIKLNSIGPSEFISLFDNAAFVCTDSFHGTAFSIIFHKPFLVWDRDRKRSITNMSRVTSLLQETDLLERYNVSKFDIRNLPDIDYKHVDKLWKKKQRNSLHYLKHNLS